MNSSAIQKQDERLLVTWREDEIESEIQEEEQELNASAYKGKELNTNENKENQKLTTTNILHSRTTSELFRQKHKIKDIVNDSEEDIDKTRKINDNDNEYLESFSAGLVNIQSNSLNYKHETNTSFTNNNIQTEKMKQIAEGYDCFISNLEIKKISQDEKDKSIIYRAEERNKAAITQKPDNDSQNIVYSYNTDRDKRMTSSFNKRNYNQNYLNSEDASDNSVIEMNPEDVDYNYEVDKDVQYKYNINQVNFDDNNAPYCNRNISFITFT